MRLHPGKRLAAATFLLALCLAPPAQAQTTLSETAAEAVRAAGDYERFDAGFYHLTLDIRLSPRLVVGQTRIDGRARGGPLERLVLDFVSGGMQVDSVRTPEGAPLAFVHADDSLEIALPAPVAPGERVAVDVYYHGLPTGAGFTADAFVFGTARSNPSLPVVWTLSEPYGARAWWPSKDHPSDKADSVALTVTLPKPLVLGSNGLRTRRTETATTTTWTWRSRYPIATYLVSLAAGVYETSSQTYTRPDTLAARPGYGALSLPIVHYQYQGSKLLESADPYRGWKRVVDVLPVMEWWFGPYPFAEEKYGHAEVTFGGGMEHQTLSSMGGNSVSLVTHELAHMWFGDLITLRYWPHLWLNEGFASYAEQLYWEARPDLYPGRAAANLRNEMNLARSAPGTLLVTGADTLRVYALFDGNRVYAKGAVVLHMLRRIVGDPAFREILHRYTGDPALRYGTAVTADFQRAAEAVYGDDLGYFFRQWVTEGSGYPVYALRWGRAAAAEGGYDVTVTLSQTQGGAREAPTIFQMPFTLAIQTEQGEERVRAFNSRAEEQFTFHVEGRPTGVVFDPDFDILRGEKVVATDAEPPALRPAIGAAYPNPADQTIRVDVTLSGAGPVVLELYDVLGRRVQRAERQFAAGPHPVEVPTGGLPSGLYVLRITAGGLAEARTVTVLHAN